MRRKAHHDGQRASTLPLSPFDHDDQPSLTTAPVLVSRHNRAWSSSPVRGIDRS